MKRVLMVTAIMLAGSALAGPAVAAMPNYDVDAYCQRIAGDGDQSEFIRHACLEQEQDAYNALKPAWDGLPQAMRGYCNEIATDSFYILKACVQQEEQATKANQQFKFQR